MTTTAAKNQARTKPVNHGAGLRRSAWLLLTSLAWASNAWAENVLEKISYTALPGGKVELTLKLSGAPGEPQVFTTDTPPRIALDLPDTRNGTSDRRVDVNTGATLGVSAVEAAGRTRVVVDLVRPSSYDTRVDGHNLIVTVSNGVSGSATTTAVAGNNPTKTVAANGTSVSNIDFRRGKNGEGRIIVNFSSEGATADVKREGDKVRLFWASEMSMEMADPTSS